MKKAQVSGSNVAVLIFLIALFMVVYIMLIPEKDRNELLGENATSLTSSKTNSYSVILLQSPGKMQDFTGEEFTEDLGSINLGIISEPETSTLSSRFEVSKYLFSTKSQDFTFNVEDLDSLESASLFFTVQNSKGDLNIELNDQIIFSSTASGLTQVQLSLNYLQTTNKLRFSTSSSISRTYYTISDLRLRKSFQIVNDKKTIPIELNEAEDGSGVLSYSVYCNQKNSNGRLRIFLNKEEISNEYLGCYNSNKELEIASSKLKQGTNEFLFEVDKGDYLLNDINLKIKSENQGKVMYKFSIPKEQYDSILNSGKDIVLNLEFNSPGKKSMDVNINNNKFTVSTEDLSYKKLINNMIKESNNFIEISPKSEFDLVELRINTE